MTSHPLNIRAHEAQAIQADRLSLIVRPMKPQPELMYVAGWGIGRSGHPEEWCSSHKEPGDDDWRRWAEGVRCPLGKPGDDLWCRETLKIGYLPNILTGEPTNASIALYDADNDWVCNEHGFNICPWWTGNRLPSCRMPRLASRFTLRVVETDCKRVQEISEAEVKATGVDPVYTIAGAWERNEWVWLARVERVAG